MTPAGGSSGQPPAEDEVPATRQTQSAPVRSRENRAGDQSRKEAPVAVLKLYNKTGDDKAKKLQEGTEKALGYIPQSVQALGRNGSFLQAMRRLQDAAGDGALDSKTRELIAIAVSAVNGCTYCVSAHRKALLEEEGASEEEITAAVEVGAMMSAYNNFIKSAGLDLDIVPEDEG
jgi:AhpD family alkylhydroperoxidase